MNDGNALAAVGNDERDVKDLSQGTATIEYQVAGFDLLQTDFFTFIFLIGGAMGQIDVEIAQDVGRKPRTVKARFGTGACVFVLRAGKLSGIGDDILPEKVFLTGIGQPVDSFVSAVIYRLEKSTLSSKQTEEEQG